MFVSLRAGWPGTFRRTVFAGTPRAQQLEFDPGQVHEVDDDVAAALESDIGAALVEVAPDDVRREPQPPRSTPLGAAEAAEEDPRPQAKAKGKGKKKEAEAPSTDPLDD